MTVTSLRRAAWLVLFAIFLVTDLPITFRPILTEYHPNRERFAAFLVLGWLFTLAYRGRVGRVIGLLMFAAIAFEGLQYFAAGRDPSIYDAAIKGAGALAGVTLALLTSMVLSYLHARPERAEAPSRFSDG
jgi:hypothetical protein